MRLSKCIDIVINHVRTTIFDKSNHMNDLTLNNPEKKERKIKITIELINTVQLAPLKHFCSSLDLHRRYYIGRKTDWKKSHVFPLI